MTADCTMATPPPTATSVKGSNFNLEASQPLQLPPWQPLTGKLISIPTTANECQAPNRANAPHPFLSP